MSNEWHGYPQHPDAHPERPWWRKHEKWLPGRRGFTIVMNGNISGHMREGWLRDGDERWCEFGDDLQLFDDERPLPPPEPRCGQVWTEDGVAFMSVVYERREIAGGIYVRLQGGIQGFMDIDTASGGVWPPRGAVLVAGPGSPWAPMVDSGNDAP